MWGEFCEVYSPDTEKRDKIEKFLKTPKSLEEIDISKIINEPVNFQDGHLINDHSLYVYLVYEQDSSLTDDPCLLKIFRKENKAEEFLQKYSEENYTNCFIKVWNVE